jgi:serine/threonine protein kinase
VSIGNFQRDLNAYKEITNAWNSINIGELTKLKHERLQSINPKQEPTRFIRDYGVYECLGSGAFGSVYRVAKRGSVTMYALKEVRFEYILFQLFIFPFIQQIDNRSLGTDPDRSFGKMINEVNIIREELRHPNIVSYYQIFAESKTSKQSQHISIQNLLDDKLYIKMELIPGSSLQDHLSLIKDTNQKISEDNIWKIFIQLILALRYLHKEKGIVHRDLTANNIMLDDEYRVKISKFYRSILNNRHTIFCSGFRFGEITYE